MKQTLHSIKIKVKSNWQSWILYISLLSSPLSFSLPKSYMLFLSLIKVVLIFSLFRLSKRVFDENRKGNATNVATRPNILTFASQYTKIIHILYNYQLFFRWTAIQCRNPNRKRVNFVVKSYQNENFRWSKHMILRVIMIWVVLMDQQARQDLCEIFVFVKGLIAD